MDLHLSVVSDGLRVVHSVAAKLAHHLFFFLLASQLLLPLNLGPLLFVLQTLLIRLEPLFMATLGVQMNFGRLCAHNYEASIVKKSSKRYL